MTENNIDDALAVIENHLFTSRINQSLKTAVGLLLTEYYSLRVQNRKLKERLKTSHTRSEQ